jgi:hypothetical protein
MTPSPALAGVDVNISIPLFGLVAAGVYAAGLPVYVAPAPPAYYVAPPVESAMFYGGYWYRPSGGNWYIAAQTGGPWAVIGVERVPYAVIGGPVLMNRAPSYGYSSPHYIGISPWYGNGRHGGDHGRGHDD